MDSTLLLAIFLLLAAMVALVPLSKAAGLGTVLGFLAGGVLIGPYGLRLVTDSETIRHVSEFGVVMMLFLIGLELQPRELWRMRHRLMLLGGTQMLLATGALAAVLIAIGMAWQAALVVGVALAMSSTAIAMQTAQQRAMTKTDAGRGTLAVLLVQDLAVIPVLALIPLLAGSSGDANPLDAVGAGIEQVAEAVDNPVAWWVGLLLIGAFVLAVSAGRFIVNPLLGFVARSQVREVFTALALAIVIGAALLTQMAGLSPALGAFLGGVVLADSEYRHELESTLEPVKGLLLGLFFISVGMSIAFSVVLTAPLFIFSMVVALVAVKIIVMFAIASLSRMPMADRLLISVLLSQAGEFAFVILQFAAGYGLIAETDQHALTVVVALSMATTPLLLLIFDRWIEPRLKARQPQPPADYVDQHHQVIVLGYGRFGQIVTRMLRTQGFSMTLIDDDPSLIQLVKEFGVKVFYGDATRLDTLHAAGVGEAELVVIALSGRERTTAIAAMLRRHFKHLKIAARCADRAHAHELMALDVDVIERETFRSALNLGAKALVSLGYAPGHADRLAEAFEHHDDKVLRDSYALRDDPDAYTGFLKHHFAALDEELQADRQILSLSSAEAADRPVDETSEGTEERR